MSKSPKIVIANCCIVLLYAGAFGISYWLGVSLDDLFKLVPTASASAVGNMITLSLALNALVKGKAKLTIGEPEQAEWSIGIPLLVDCRGSSGITIEGVEAPGLDFIGLFEPTDRTTARPLPAVLHAGDVAEFEVRFEVLEGSKNEIVTRRRLSISCVHRAEGRQRRSVTSKKCSNTFRIR
jgi:hypothetical protein